MPVFGPKHRFLDEAVEYHCTTVALVSGVHLAVALEQITRLAGIVNVLLRGESSYDSGLVTFPAILEKMPLSEGRRADIVTLYDCGKVHQYMSGQAPRPSRVKFSVRKNHLSNDVPEARRRSSNARPPPGEWKVKRSGSSLLKLANLTVGNLIGDAYENARADIYRYHGSTILSWPQELQFFRHMRNGCVHGNEFDIRKYEGREPIDANAPPRWKTYVVPDRISMHGKKVIDEFFPRNQLLPFLFDVGNII